MTGPRQLPPELHAELAEVRRLRERAVDSVHEAARLSRAKYTLRQRQELADRLAADDVQVARRASAQLRQRVAELRAAEAAGTAPVAEPVVLPPDPVVEEPAEAPVRIPAGRRREVVIPVGATIHRARPDWATWAPVGVGVALVLGLVGLSRAQAEGSTETTYGSTALPQVLEVAPAPAAPAAPVRTQAGAAPVAPLTRTQAAAPAIPAPSLHHYTQAPATSGSGAGTTAPRHTSTAPRPSAAATTAALPVTPSLSAPPAVVAPHVGRYTYLTSENAGSDAPVTVAVSQPAAGQVQETTYGTADTTAERRTWSPTGVLLGSSVAGGHTCQWSPASVYLPLALSPSATWNTDASCVIPVDGSGHTATLHQVSKAVVKAGGFVRIGSQPVFVWAISRTATLTETVTEPLTGSTSVATTEQQSTDLFAPALGLVVQTTQQTSSPAQDGTAVSTFTITRLVDPTPH